MNELVGEYRRLAANVAERRERATQTRALADHAETQAERDERVLHDFGGVLVRLGNDAEPCTGCEAS